MKKVTTQWLECRILSYEYLTQHYAKATSSRLIGSLNAESMTSFVGTIFHLGMISSTLVNRLTTIGWGFNFSDIWSFEQSLKK